MSTVAQPLRGPRMVIFGANGQVGWELQRSLQPLGQVIALARADAPLNDAAALLAALEQHQPQVIVNAAAYTAVDKAESEPDLAHAINGQALQTIGQWAAKHQALVVHYGTDYVFDGSGQQFRAETDPVAPLSVYGASKLAGEQALADSGCAHLCFRTSWVYAARGGNFAKTMLRLACEKDALNVVNDQHGAPTGADLIADATAHALKQCLSTVFDEKFAGCRHVHSLHCYQFNSECLGNLGGAYHLVAAGSTNWHAYAQLVIETARSLGHPIRVQPDAVRGIPSAQYPTPAKRPLNSRLNCDKFEANFGLALPPWDNGVKRLVRQWAAH
jgi:dTDP-4-dehydrorhamnose reductase